MLKRNVAVLVVSGLVLGGGAVAWAGDAPSRPTVLAAAQAGGTSPTSAPATADRQANWEAVRACVEKAGEDRAARRACLAAVGVAKASGTGVHKGRTSLGAAGALGRAVHGTLLVPAEGGGWQTVTFDRGTVDEASDGTKIVLNRPDGQQVTLALTAATRYRGIADAAGIQDGRPALVVSKDGKATQVVQKDPARAKRSRPGNNREAPVVPND